MPRRSLVIRCVYAACLLGATWNHLLIVVRHGLLWDYGGVGWLSAAFWTSLTVADPLAALLLLVRPRDGVVATGIIISVDVVHNLWIISILQPSCLWEPAVTHPYAGADRLPAVRRCDGPFRMVEAHLICDSPLPALASTLLVPVPHCGVRQESGPTQS